MTSPARPRCPSCGYEIFGIRDMRCPECGRTLVHADFNFSHDDSQARQKKLRRDARIGIPIALIGLLIPLGLLGLLSYVFLQYHVMPCYLPIAIIFLIIWIGAVLKWILDEALPAKKRPRPPQRSD